MARFNVTVREHAYTGRFHSDTVEAESCEQALQLAARRGAAPHPPPAARLRRGPDAAVTEPPATARPDHGVTPAEPREQAQHPAAGHVGAPPPGADAPPRRGFHVAVTEHTPAGRLYTDVVQAGSCEQALQLAAERASEAHPPPAPPPQPGAAARPRCADVWVYSLLHCEREQGHDPPHMALAPGHRRPVRWVRDEAGIAHEVPQQPAVGRASSLT